MGAGHNNRAKRTCNTYIRTGVRMPTCQALIYLEDGMDMVPCARWWSLLSLAAASRCIVGVILSTAHSTPQTPSCIQLQQFPVVRCTLSFMLRSRFICASFVRAVRFLLRASHAWPVWETHRVIHANCFLLGQRFVLTNSTSDRHDRPLSGYKLPEHTSSLNDNNFLTRMMYKNINRFDDICWHLLFYFISHIHCLVAVCQPLIKLLLACLLTYLLT